VDANRAPNFRYSLAQILTFLFEPIRELRFKETLVKICLEWTLPAPKSRYSCLVPAPFRLLTSFLSAVVRLSYGRSAWDCPANVVSMDVLSSTVFCLIISVRRSLDNAVFTASKMTVYLVAEIAFTSKETKPGLVIAGWNIGGSAAVSSYVHTRLERVWRSILDGCAALFPGGINYR